MANYDRFGLGMNNQPIRIRGDQQKAFAMNQIAAINPDVEDVEVVIKPFKMDRSKAQNRLYYRWISDIEKQRDGETVNSVRYEMKLDHGVPILMAYDMEFRDWWIDNGFNRLNREAQLQSMKYTPVTSLLKVKPFTAMLQSIERQAIEQGWQLTHPRDIYDMAMGG